MARKGKLPASKEQSPYLYRVAGIDRAEARDDDRSIPLVLATEDPIPAFDFMRGEIVDEVLHFDGMEIPQQVPMVDSHQRDSVRNVLGSIRDLKVDGSKLVGRAYFASDPESQRVYENYRDGHLNAFSVGASVKASTYGSNNTKHVTRSVLREGSAVVAGQDPGATALRAYSDPELMRDDHMREQVRQMLIARGLDENASDADALQMLEESLTSTVGDNEEVATVVTSQEVQDEPVAEVTETQPEESEETEMAATDDTAAAVAAERSRVTEINDIARRYNVSDDVCRNAIDGGMSAPEFALTVVRAKNRDSVATEPIGGTRIESGVSEREKFYNAVESGLLKRLADTRLINPTAQKSQSGDPHAVQRGLETEKALEKPSDGADDFRFARLPDIARMFLERSGERVFGLSQPEIVRRAMAQQHFIERSDAATNTTGTFSNLLLDAANKTLLAGYDEAPATYSQWVRMAPSASDFKQLHRIRFGELADPEVVPENMPYSEKATSDAKESYGVEKYGEIFSISFEAVVNDDLNAMTRVPQMQGAAMRRKVNKVCYNILTANDALSDGIALFHASSHGANLDGNALAESALDTGYAVMLNQTGLSGTGTPLGISPSFLIVPPALSATALRLVNGGVVPEAVSNVPLYGPGGARPLQVVVEAQLTSNSTTAWYLAASSSLVDTVEITFLQGEEAPVLSREEGFSTDTLKYKIRQTFAAKAIDFRGLYQGNS